MQLSDPIGGQGRVLVAIPRSPRLPIDALPDDLGTDATAGR
jgi:hypothetical protein